MSESLSMQQILNILFRKWKVLVASCVVAAILFLVYTICFIEPLYVSHASLYVSSSSSSQTVQAKADAADISDIAFATMLADTYAIILKSDRFMNIVLDDTNISGFTAGALKSCIQIEPVDETEVLQISVTTTDPEMSRKIAQSILDNAEEEIIRIVELGSVKTIDDASRPRGKSSPSNFVNTVMGGMFGFVVAAGLIILIEMMNTSVKNAEELESNYGIPVLGIIPRLEAPLQQNVDGDLKKNEGGAK